MELNKLWIIDWCISVLESNLIVDCLLDIYSISVSVAAEGCWARANSGAAKSASKTSLSIVSLADGILFGSSVRLLSSLTVFLQVEVLKNLD